MVGVSVVMEGIGALKNGFEVGTKEGERVCPIGSEDEIDEIKSDGNVVGSACSAGK